MAELYIYNTVLSKKQMRASWANFDSVCDHLDFELKLKFLDNVGMLRTKEKCNKKTNGFSFPMDL